MRGGAEQPHRCSATRRGRAGWSGRPIARRPTEPRRRAGAARDQRRRGGAAAFTKNRDRLLTRDVAVAFDAVLIDADKARLLSTSTSPIDATLLEALASRTSVRPRPVNRHRRRRYPSENVHGSVAGMPHVDRPRILTRGYTRKARDHDAQLGNRGQVADAASILFGRPRESKETAQTSDV